MQILLKSAKSKSAAPASAPRVSRKGSENSGTASRRGKGGGFAVNTSKKLGLSGGGRRDRRRRRESESSSEEEVLPKKKPRSKMVAVVDDEEEMDTDEDDDDEEERIKLGKIGKKSGEKVAKTGTYRNAESDEEVQKGNAVKSGKTAGKNDSLMKKKAAERKEESDEEEGRSNFGRSDRWGGKNASLMKKKEVERKDDSDDDVGTFVKRAKRNSKMLLNDKNKKVLKDDRSDDQEEERGDVLNKSGGKEELGRKKKKAEVDDESEEEEEKPSEELVKSRGGVQLANKKKKVVQNYQSEDEEEEWHKNVVDSVKMKGKIDVGKKENSYGSETSDEEEANEVGKSGERYSELEFKWKEKKVESSEETEEEEVERGRELTRAQNSGGLKWGNRKRKALRNNHSVIEGGKHSVSRGRNKSPQFKQRQKKKSGWRASSDEEEEGEANAERVDNKGGRLDLGRKEKLEGDDVGTDDEDLRSAVKSDESADELVIDLKGQKIQGTNESNQRDGVAKSVEKGDAARLGKTKKTLLETEACDEEEEGIEHLKGNNRAELLKTSKIKGLRTKTLQMGIKSILDKQENYGNGGTNDTVKDGNIDDAKKKSHFWGKSEDVEKGKANRNSEDGGEEISQLIEKRNEVRKEIKEEYDGDHADDSEKMHDDCLLRSAEKDLKPQASSKIEGKKLKEEKGGLLKMLKVEKEEKASQEGTVDGENVDSLRAAKKAKKTVEVDSPPEERRKGLKIKDIGERKEEEVDNTDYCNIGVHSVRERSSRKKSSRPKADLRRRHFSTDVSFLPSFKCMYLCKF